MSCKKITFNNEEKYMFFTSNLFYIPTLVGYYRNYHYLTLLNFGSALITTKFWKTGNNDIYRKLDLLYQPFYSIILFMYGNISSRNQFLLLSGNLFFMNGLYFYYRSHTEYNKKRRLWYINHLIFHISMFSSNFLIYF